MRERDSTESFCLELADDEAAVGVVAFPGNLADFLPSGEYLFPISSA